MNNFSGAHEDMENRKPSADNGQSLAHATDSAKSLRQAKSSKKIDCRLELGRSNKKSCLLKNT